MNSSKRKITANATINHVADAAGVSYQTVSRVLNNSPHVAEETRKRVEEAIASLRYRPNQTARHLVKRNSTVIGVVMHDIGKFGPTQTLLGIAEAARSKGFAIMAMSVEDYSWKSIRHALDELHGHRVMGTILMLKAPAEPGHIDEIVAAGPVVAMNSEIAPGLACVEIDQMLGVRLAVKHLVTLGHVKIAHISGPLDWTVARARRLAWTRAMKQAGLSANIVVEGDWTLESGYRLGKELLAAHRGKISAVVSANDHMAIGLKRACHELGVKVPQELAIVGFDGIPEAAYQEPPLTTVYQDFVKVGRECVRLLLEQVEGGASGERVLIKPSLVIRESTDWQNK